MKMIRDGGLLEAIYGGRDGSEHSLFFSAEEVRQHAI
jgi:hypothetical protein